MRTQHFCQKVTSLSLRYVNSVQNCIKQECTMKFNHFHNKLNEYISSNSSQALSTLHVFWDSPCMFLIQLTDLEECCVLRTATLHLIPYLLFSLPTVLFMDNTSYTTTSDYRKYRILKSTQIMLKPICVKQKYIVSNDFAFYLYLYAMYRDFFC